jgi:hypothetical protein
MDHSLELPHGGVVNEVMFYKNGNCFEFRRYFRSVSVALPVISLAARNQCNGRSEIITWLPSWRCPTAGVGLLFTLWVRRDRVLTQLPFRSRGRRPS